MNSLYVILFAVFSYFVGNINWAIIIAKIKHTDIRKMGSGNPGTLNVSRNLGLKLGLLTFFLDILKGAVPTLIAYFVFKGIFISNSTFELYDFAIYLTGLCVVMGHIFPVVFKFKGGKGIASTIGVLLVCESIHGVGFAMVAIMALVCAAVFIYFTEFGAMGSFIAITPPAISGCIYLFMKYSSFTMNATEIVFYIATSMLVLAICFFTWFAHRKNIERMLSGDEHPTSIKSMIVKMKEKKLAEKLKVQGEVLEDNNGKDAEK